jgi:uncharacterized protein
MVRAKVNAIRSHQPQIDKIQKKESEIKFTNYLNLAFGYIKPGKPQLIITHGLSGSGKSTLTQPILEHVGAIRIRSDVERKRLFGIKPNTGAPSEIFRGIYTPETTDQIYHQLAAFSAQIIDAGYPVIVDATFLDWKHRLIFQKLAATKHVPFFILDFIASPEILRQRISKRRQDVSDADLAVLEHQLSFRQALSEDENLFVMTVDTEKEFNINHWKTELINKR